MESDEKKEEVKQDAEATSKEDSAEKSTFEGVSTDIEISPENEKMLKESKDVSIEDLKAARLASLSDKSVESDEKVPEPKKEEGDEQVKSESPDESLDEVLKDIVNEEQVKKEVPEEKNDRPQHKVDGEWKRKYDELRKEIDEVKSKKPEAPKIEPYSKEWYDALADELNQDPEDVKKTITLLERGYQSGIAPQIEALKDEIKKLKSKETANSIKSKAEKDELYSIVKDDYNSYYKEFADKGLPEDIVADYAMSKAKEKNYPKLIKAVRKHEKARAKDQRRVIPSEEASVGYSGMKVSSNLPSNLTAADKEIMRKLGYTKKDVETFGKTPKGFIEK